jgi:hypothetical protein
MADEHDHGATWVARVFSFHAVGWVTDHVARSSTTIAGCNDASGLVLSQLHFSAF